MRIINNCSFAGLISIISIIIALVVINCDSAQIRQSSSLAVVNGSVSNSSEEIDLEAEEGLNQNISISLEYSNETEIGTPSLSHRDSKYLSTQIDERDESLIIIENVDEILLDSVQTVKEKAIQNLMKVFGLSSNSSIQQRHEISSKLGPAPEFMIDLYNTITDSFGVTRARNPYNAHIVRSYMEKDNSLNDYFFFNVTVGMSPTENILEAELHLHRMKTHHEDLHPSLYLTPFYILSLYQVQDPNMLHIPDLHKLLGVNYVPALGSGWEVFNVKQAVLEWIKGDRPNHGFLIAATSLSGDRVPVRFSRRGETVHHSKQPILVLFNEDSDLEVVSPTYSPPLIIKKNSIKSENKNNSIDPIENEEDNEQLIQIPTSSLENPRFHHALLYKDSIRHPNSVNRFRSRRSKNITETSTRQSTNTISNEINENMLRNNLTECSRHDLFVSFESIGWASWIISPKSYNAFYCDGPCKFPLGQQVKPTNHATVQSIVYELNLSAGIQRPCCVPTNLLPISLLFYDDHDNVVLKQYVDMVAESCGCH